MVVERVAVLDNLRFDHFAEQVVALAGAFADTGKYRIAVRTDRHVVDQLHDQNRLAHAGTAEQADLAATEKGLDEVNDLDARLEHFEACRLFVKARRMAVDR